MFEGKAVVFEGPEDYHERIEDPALGVDAHSILVIRNCGPVGYPGGAEVVNMQPPAALLKAGIHTLPTMGDGRQSGTSGSPSILNVSPEAVIGGGLALLHTGRQGPHRPEHPQGGRAVAAGRAGHAPRRRGSGRNCGT